MNSALATRRPVLSPYVIALRILARTTLGLFAHGLRRPGAPAVIDRLTGKVAPR
jgi:hypothetical protein